MENLVMKEQQLGDTDGDNGQDPDHPHQNPMTYLVMTDNIDGGAGNAEFDDYFPPGYRFMPEDHELLYHYLQKKISGEPLPQNRIMEVNLYLYNPMTLAETYKPFGEKKWYFFTPREKKYKRGKKPNRAAGDGFWKATGADKKISIGKTILGFKRALVFYLGKPPKGKKTNWLMQEYRLDAPPRMGESEDDMRLDDWVLCKIYIKNKHAKSRLMSSLPSRQQDSSGCDDQQSDISYQDHRSIDVGGETASTAGGPECPGISDMRGCSQEGFINSYDNTYQNQLGHLNVSAGMPNHNLPYCQGWLPGFAAHNVSDSQGWLPEFTTHIVADSQGWLPGFPNYNASISDFQARLTGFTPYSYDSLTGHNSAWAPHSMIPSPTLNSNQVVETLSSPVAAAARPFQAYDKECMFATSNQNHNQASESSAFVAERAFQQAPPLHDHRFAAYHQNPYQPAESSLPRQQPLG